MKTSDLDQDRPPEAPNGKNPLIERAAWSARRLGLTRVKANWGYIVLLGVLLPAMFSSCVAAWRGEWGVCKDIIEVAAKFALPVVTAVVVGNVARAVARQANGGDNEPD